jgi:protein-S-isoprenylcysteine O-methyltransferase Ste14
MSPTDGPHDHAGVIAPPPVIAAATVVCGLVLDRILPAYVLTVLIDFSTRVVIAALLAVAGGALALAAEIRFKRAGTATMPWKPASALVTDGVYAHVRNPMYVALALVVAAIAVAVASDWTLVLMVPAALVMHFGVVRREERYLTARFGEAYRRYTDTVRRYGWPP